MFQLSEATSTTISCLSTDGIYKLVVNCSARPASVKNKMSKQTEVRCGIYWLFEMSPGSLCVADDPLSCLCKYVLVYIIMYICVVTFSRNGIGSIRSEETQQVYVVALRAR